MKNISIICLLFVVSFFLYIQSFSAQTFGYLNQTVDISMYQKNQFKFTGNIKKVSANKSSIAYLYLTLTSDSKEDDELLFETTYETPVTENWKTFTIEGIIDPKATSLVFGMVCMNDGTYLFDDFRLAIQNENDAWKEISLKNPDFEENTNNIKSIWENDHLESNDEVFAKIINTNSKTGNHCLQFKIKQLYGVNVDNGGFVTVNGVKLYYEIYGEGEPLLLLHGAGQSINAFKSQISFFSKKYKVIALDSRGRGKSTDNDDELTYTNQAKDVKEFLDALALDKVHIVGWSDGGIIGLIVAINYPEKVDKLVAMAANIFPEGLLPDRLKIHKENLKRLEEDSKSEKDINYKITNQLVNHPQLTFDDLSAITAPTLIMAGDHDLITDEHTVKIFQSIPKANLAIFPGETHWFPSSNSKLFNSTVLDFLQKEFKKPRRY